MSDTVERILHNYAGESAGVIGNLRRLMQHGEIGGTGKLVILPVDQGFEHGPVRSFGAHPGGYDPEYHISLAVESGCSAYAAPVGFLDVVAAKYAGTIPLILKVNNSDLLGGPEAPHSAVTSTVEDALRLGCSAVGFTIYPGSSARNAMYAEARELIQAARKVGLPTILWAYARGALSKDGETGIDTIAYSAHVACELGAHIVKVKAPTDFIEAKDVRRLYESVPIASLSDRIRHVVQSSFNGKRIVIFSGGATKGTDDVLKDLREIAAGGGFGTIMGRNAFQRPRAEGVALLREAIRIFKG